MRQFFERRLGIKWYELNSDKIEIVKVNSRHKPFTNLGKLLTVAGDDQNQVAIKLTGVFIFFTLVK